MYDGPSSYLAERERCKQAEHEYWNDPKMRGPETPLVRITELETVRGAIQAVMRSMDGSGTWDEAVKHYRKLVDYGVLSEALDTLRHYEKLLTKEPLVEQIANDWRETGAFFKGPEGIV